MTTRPFWFFLAVLAAVGCTSVREPASAHDVALVSPEGSGVPFDQWVGRAPWTVFVFVAKDCPCLDAHGDRIVALARRYGPRGVQFLGVDSEVGSTPASASREAARLGFPFPILVDRGAELANVFDAQYATYSVVVDRSGHVVYSGGLDTDKRKLHDDATFYVQEALDDVLAGKPPRRSTGKALGCSLRKW